jgi:hypothetical protein
VSALAEALVAAQRRALQAVEKQYVAGKLDHDGACTCLNLIGLTDAVDQDRLFFALDMIRDYGAALPGEPTNGAAEKPAELASQRQREWIADLFGKSSHVPMDSNDVARLTKGQASKLIDALQNGTYDAATWDVPI